VAGIIFLLKKKSVLNIDQLEFENQDNVEKRTSIQLKKIQQLSNLKEILRCEALRSLPKRLSKEC